MTDDWQEEAWDEQAEDCGDDIYGGDDLEEELAPCPECGIEMSVDAEMCPHCGHWLTTAERHQLWDGGSPVRGAMSVGKVVLVVILVVLMLGFLCL